MALLNRIRAQMMAGYHSKVAPVERIRSIEGVLILQSKNGGLVLLAPVDFVVLTKSLEDKVNAFENTISKMTDISGKEVWITGKFDAKARSLFESNGWKVKENANSLLLKKD